MLVSFDVFDDSHFRSRKWYCVDYVSKRSGNSYRKYFDDIDSAFEWCRSHESRISKAVFSINRVCEYDVIIDDTDHASPAVLGSRGNLILGQMTVDDFLP